MEVMKNARAIEIPILKERKNQISFLNSKLIFILKDRYFMIFFFYLKLIFLYFSVKFFPRKNMFWFCLS